MIVKFGASSLRLRVRLLKNDGEAITGVAYNSAPLSVSYLRPADAAWQSVALVSGTVGTYASGGWAEIGGGVYELGLPDDAIVDGERTNLRITYASYDPQYDAIDAVGLDGSKADIAAAINPTGEGDTIVEVTVKDDSAVVVAGANVSIYASDGTPMGIYALTNVLGVATFNLNDDDYLAGITSKSGFNPHVAEAFTVAPANIVGGVIPVALTFTRTTSVAPVDPALCRVKCYVTDASGTAAADVKISATPLSRSLTVPSKIVTLIAATATTDATGYAELLLPRTDAISSLGSKSYRFTIRKDGSGVYDNIEKAIPNVGETTLDVIVNS